MQHYQWEKSIDSKRSRAVGKRAAASEQQTTFPGIMWVAEKMGCSRREGREACVRLCKASRRR